MRRKWEDNLYEQNKILLRDNLLRSKIKILSKIIFFEISIIYLAKIVENFTELNKKKVSLLFDSSKYEDNEILLIKYKNISNNQNYE